MRVFHLSVVSLSLFLVSGSRAQDKSARAYFEEIKNAGGFMHTLTFANGEKQSYPEIGYVCFADNSPMAERGGVFLTFGTMAYDKNYAEAWAMVLKSKPGSEDRSKALAYRQGV